MHDASKGGQIKTELSRSAISPLGLTSRDLSAEDSRHRCLKQLFDLPNINQQKSVRQVSLHLNHRMSNVKEGVIPESPKKNLLGMEFDLDLISFLPLIQAATVTMPPSNNSCHKQGCVYDTSSGL